MLVFRKNIWFTKHYNFFNAHVMSPFPKNYRRFVSCYWQQAQIDSVTLKHNTQKSKYNINYYPVGLGSWTIGWGWPWYFHHWHIHLQMMYWGNTDVVLMQEIDLQNTNQFIVLLSISCKEHIFFKIVTFVFNRDTYQ